MKAIPDAEEDLDLLDDVYTRFLQMKVDIVDNLNSKKLFEKKKEKNEHRTLEKKCHKNSHSNSTGFCPACCAKLYRHYEMQPDSRHWRGMVQCLLGCNGEAARSNSLR